MGCKKSVSVTNLYMYIKKLGVITTMTNNKCVDWTTQILGERG